MYNGNMASVTVNDNTLHVERDILQRASIFLRTVADEIVDISTPRTPKKTGSLRNEILKQVLGLKGKVVWGVNYAIFQEKRQFRNYTTSGTGPHFAENAVKIVVKNTDKIARKVGLTQ